MDSKAELLLGEQHDTEAGSKVATVQRKINTVKLKLVTSFYFVCRFSVCICCSNRANATASVALLLHVVYVWSAAIIWLDQTQISSDYQSPDSELISCSEEITI